MLIAWVSSSPSIKIQWYVVDIVKSCPVAIPSARASDVYAECVSPDMKQCGKKYNDKTFILWNVHNYVCIDVLHVL